MTSIGFRISQLLLTLLIISLPSQLGLHFWPKSSFIHGIRVDFLSPTIFLTDIISACLILLNFRHLKSHLTSPAFKILLLFSLFNLAVSFSPFTTVYRLLRLCMYLSLFLVIRAAKLISLPHAVSLLSLALFWSSSLALAQFIFQSSIGGPLYWLGERTFTSLTPGIAQSLYPYLSSSFDLNWHLLLRPYATFSHPNSLAGFISVSLVILSFHRSRSSQLTSIFAFFVLLLTQSRAALLALIFSWYLRSRHYLRFYLIIIPLAVTVFVTLSLLSSNSTSERLSLITSSLQIISSHPFGTGLGSYLHAQNSPYNLSLSQLRPSLPFEPVHNIPLLLLSEIGIIPLLFIVFFLTHYFSFKLSRPTPPRFLSQQIFTILFITSLFDHYWLTLHQNTLLLIIFLSLIYSSPQTS